jgi:hypothetical protein
MGVAQDTARNDRLDTSAHLSANAVPSSDGPESSGVNKEHMRQRGYNIEQPLKRNEIASQSSLCEHSLPFRLPNRLLSDLLLNRRDRLLGRRRGKFGYGHTRYCLGWIGL